MIPKALLPNILSRQERYRFLFYKRIPTFFQMADIPVDLYFLLDASNSMKDTANRLIKAADDTAKKIEELTDDYRFGVGSFREKPRIPFAEETDDSFSFHHVMSLDKNIAEFKKKVEEVKDNMTANIDSPESGMWRQILCFGFMDRLCHYEIHCKYDAAKCG